MGSAFLDRWINGLESRTNGRLSIDKLFKATEDGHAEYLAVPLMVA